MGPKLTIAILVCACRFRNRGRKAGRDAMNQVLLLADQPECPQLHRLLTRYGKPDLNQAEMLIRRALRLKSRMLR